MVQLIKEMSVGIDASMASPPTPASSMPSADLQAPSTPSPQATPVVLPAPSPTPQSPATPVASSASSPRLQPPVPFPRVPVTPTPSALAPSPLGALTVMPPPSPAPRTCLVYSTVYSPLAQWWLHQALSLHWRSSSSPAFSQTSSPRTSLSTISIHICSHVHPPQLEDELSWKGGVVLWQAEPVQGPRGTVPREQCHE